MYGADVEKRREIFEALLPDEIFVDRRLVTEEMIAQMEEEKFGQRGGYAVEGEDIPLNPMPEFLPGGPEDSPEPEECFSDDLEDATPAGARPPPEIPEEDHEPPEDDP